MSKKDFPQCQVSSEYADCLERAFCPEGFRPTVAASEGVAKTSGLLGAMGNTPSSTSHMPGLGDISEDTVHLSVWADFGLCASSFFGRLHASQLEARSRACELPDSVDNEECPLDFDPDKIEGYEDLASSAEPSRYFEGCGQAYFEFGNQLWKCKANGIGGKEGRSYYPYVIHVGGVLIGFRRDSHETVSNVWIEIGSIPLAQHGGLSGCWKLLKEMFVKEGIHITRDLVSRVDMYADFDGVSVSEFCERFRRGHRVTRARKTAEYSVDEMNSGLFLQGRQYTGFSVGSTIKLRCYDKNLELQSDPIKRGVFFDKYNGLPSILTRVEFQLRRLALKEFLVDGRERIEGVDSYLACREQLWAYLTRDWFRFVDGNVDVKNNHQSRASTWSVWERVQNAVVLAYKEIFRCRRDTKFNLEHLYKMALGCVVKLAIWENESIEEASDVLRHFWERVKSGGLDAYNSVYEKHRLEQMLATGFNPVSG